MDYCPPSGFLSLFFDHAVPYYYQRHLADWNAIYILHRQDCARLLGCDTVSAAVKKHKQKLAREITVSSNTPKNQLCKMGQIYMIIEDFKTKCSSKF